MTSSSESEPVLRTAFKVGAESDQAVTLMVGLPMSLVDECGTIFGCVLVKPA